MDHEARALRQRFFVEIGLGAASLLLFVVTLIRNDWIEVVLRVDPDGGNGAVEYFVCFVLLVAVAVSSWLARTEWRRFRAPSAAAERL